MMKYNAFVINADQPELYNIEDLVTNLFGDIIESGREIDDFSIYKKTDIVVCVYDNCISLINMPVIHDFFISKNKNDRAAKIFKASNQAEEIIIVYCSDGGPRYGYGYIKNGQLVRYRYNDNSIHFVEDGVMQPEELPIVSALYYIEQETGDNLEMYKPINRNFGEEPKCDQNFYILDNFLVSKTGYSMYTIDDRAEAAYYFRVKL